MSRENGVLLPRNDRVEGRLAHTRKETMFKNVMGGSKLASLTHKRCKGNRKRDEIVIGTHKHNQSETETFLVFPS